MALTSAVAEVSAFSIVNLLLNLVGTDGSFTGDWIHFAWVIIGIFFQKVNISVCDLRYQLR